MERICKLDPWREKQPPLTFLQELTEPAEAELVSLPFPAREPWLKTRITRCFFSPINRPPKNGDELSDDIDYYPEEYLNRLERDGTNGVWIYSRFSDLVPSSFLPTYGKGYEKRIAKLNRVIEKCGRHGIKVYLFAIEPVALPPIENASAEVQNFLDEVNGGNGSNGNRLFCVNTEKGQAFCREMGKRLFTLCPQLGGLISITYGERPTSCSSAYSMSERDFGSLVRRGRPMVCPRCQNLPAGKAIANAAAALRLGVREVAPQAEVISWTYGARLLPHEQIREYVRDTPADVVLMQNFEEMGEAVQLGRKRLGVDYWLSYPGPSALFTVTAEEAQKTGKPLFMKTQVCCSHELATVPYVPVPSILFEKYRQAHALGVSGVMQCWYFGNYPSMMSRAAGLLAYQEDFSAQAEEKFLHTLASLWWEEKDIPAVVTAWKEFSAGYRSYPLNIMFSYYGPVHDGVVWELALKPKNFSLSRSWQLLDPTDGDRIGECLMQGHTVEEAIILLNEIVTHWEKGMSALRNCSVKTHAQQEQMTVAEACGILFASGKNILEFYRLRDLVGHMTDTEKNLLAMEALVKEEIRHSARLAELCLADGRLGYHSECEGYKYFPEKLQARIASLRKLLTEEFPSVRAEFSATGVALPYYLGKELDAKAYSLTKSAWETVGCGAFRGSYDTENVYLDFAVPENTEVSLVPEFHLFYPECPVTIRDGVLTVGEYDVLYQGLTDDENAVTPQKVAARYTVTKTEKGFTVALSRADIGFTDMRFPFRMRIQIGSSLWCTEENPVRTLGKGLGSPLEFGWFTT